MLILGIETSCDETGVALYDTGSAGLLGDALHSQVDLHAVYGGVVPELASRDHIRRLLPLDAPGPRRAGQQPRRLDLHRLYPGPGPGRRPAGRRLRRRRPRPRAGHARARASITSKATCSRRCCPRRRAGFPFVALLVSGGHTQLMRVDGVGRYRAARRNPGRRGRRSLRQDREAAGLGYPGRPGAGAARRDRQRPAAIELPRPMIAQRRPGFQLQRPEDRGAHARASTRQPDEPRRISRAPSSGAVVDVLVAKCLHALGTEGLERLVVAGGVGANRQLRAALARSGAARRRGVLSGAAAVHRQRRDDRLRRRAAAGGGRPGTGLQREAALGSGGLVFFLPSRHSVPAARREMFSRWRHARSSASPAATILPAFLAQEPRVERRGHRGRQRGER